MWLEGFAVIIPEGRERTEGYVEMIHGVQYSVVVKNNTPVPCSAEVHMNGRYMGTWRVDAHTSTSIERPVHTINRFTFHRSGTPNDPAAQGDTAGEIRVTFRPEHTSKTTDTAVSPQRSLRITDDRDALLDNLRSNTRQVENRPTYDDEKQVTIHLRLVAREERPGATNNPPILKV
jgi:hypothetical protein